MVTVVPGSDLVETHLQVGLRPTCGGGRLRRRFCAPRGAMCSYHLPPMIVSVTPLGDSSGTMSPSEVGRRIADYLEGVGLAKPGRRPGRTIELPSLTGDGTVAYYADSTGIRPGRWIGNRAGDVDPQQLAALLSGVDPDTGEPLESALNSARGRHHTADLSALRNGAEWLGTFDAAAAIGVRHSYLQRLAKDAENDLAARQRGGEPPRRRGVKAVALAAVEAGTITKTDGGVLLFHRDALVALAEARRPATNVAGYDITFSVPKDVSLLWARGDDDVRAEVLASIDAAVEAGWNYLERNALEVRVSGEQQTAHNWTGADYLHLTSRALDPQLHHHRVLVNRAEDAEGNVRAIDGRPLFHHAKTIGTVAASELRQQLAGRLGVTFGKVVNGLAPILGIAPEVLAEFSTRSREINEAVKALGAGSAAARQVAAYDTRSAKEAGFDFDEVTQWWAERMDAVGFDEQRLDEVLHRVDGPGIVTDPELDDLFRSLLRVTGITENEARFDRRMVIQAIAEFSVDRLSGAAIEELADRFLALDPVVQLQGGRDTSRRDVIRLRDGRVVKVPSTGYFTTRAHLALEQRAMSLYLDGRRANAGVVPVHVLDQVLAEPRFARLTDEQRAFVTALTTSGHRIQGAVGRAGSGKTTSMEAAVAAWRAAGYQVLGSAVGGTQTVLLAEEATGNARTVASVLARYFDFDDPSLITERTVLLVDEASLLSTRDLALLERAVAERPGAVLRLIGDQEQHTSVAAGGFFRWLVEEHADDVPELRTVYRQQGDEQAEVRLALDEYRDGMIVEAIERLERDGRIAEAGSFDEACDLLTCAWYAERGRRIDEPTRKLSSMTADHHHERRELNRRARALLQADGTLAGPELEVDGIGFQVNDEVIARIGDHDLRAPGAAKDQWVRNGSRGVVREVATDHLVVEFERWGSVTVPLGYIESEVVPGVRGGLMHSYALTTHAAQGTTMAAAMPLVSDASSREGAYVALTRHQFHLNAVAIRYDKIVERVVDDALPIARTELADLKATARAIARDERERLASQVDPFARRVNELATSLDLRQLVGHLPELVEDDVTLYERAAQERIRTISLRAATDPSGEVLSHLGARPSTREQRAAWDTAVGAIAVYRELHAAQPDPAGEDVAWALGPRPEDPDEALEYDRFAAHVRALDPSPDDADTTAGETAADFGAAAVTSYAHLEDADLLDLAVQARGSLAEQMRILEDLGRTIELQLHLISERQEAGLDTTVLARQLEATNARYDAAEALHEAMDSDLATINDELFARGLTVEEEKTRSVAQVAADLAPEPVAPDVDIERPGPELEL